MHTSLIKIHNFSKTETKEEREKVNIFIYLIFKHEACVQKLNNLLALINFN